MRVAVVSDIHSNLAAFEAVAADFGAVDEVWCLGDIVGYGPDPNECIRLLQRYTYVCVAGNHDWAAIGKLSTADFNPDAQVAAAWTGAHLSAASLDFILNCPMRVERQGYTLAHGTPRDPIREYLLHTWQAAECFADFATQCCFIGHSHVPLIFEQTPTGAQYDDPEYSEPFELGSTRYIVNPGSVGQPRDGDPRASYVLLDPAAAELEFRRVPYDTSITQQRMRAVGLPSRLWQRLSYGM